MTQAAVQRFEARLQGLVSGPGDGLKGVREQTFARFLELGLPTTGHEEWRYTPLSGLADLALRVPAHSRRVQPAELEGLVGSPEGIRLVFVDGRWDPQLSSLSGLPAGVRVRSVREAIGQKHERLVRPIDDQGRALTALNSALMEDGALVEVSSRVAVEHPIEWLFVSTGEAVAVHPRNVIVAEVGARVSVRETFVSLGDAPYLTNAVTSVVLGPNASVVHCKLQTEAASAYHLGLLQVSQDRDSQFRSHAVQLGAALGRHEVRVSFDGPGAQATLLGLYVGQGKQLLDNHIVVDHAHRSCASRELFKGILSDHAHGVFNGKVVVREGANQTDSSQINKNLILSEGALADTRPQLEIFADDVKCTHGAVIGRLDESAMFYLRSRGIPLAAARNLLTYAFASEMLSLIDELPYRERVQRLVQARLPEGERLGALA